MQSVVVIVAENDNLDDEDSDPKDAWFISSGYDGEDNDDDEEDEENEYDNIRLYLSLSSPYFRAGVSLPLISDCVFDRAVAVVFAFLVALIVIFAVIPPLWAT